jgi:Fe-S oxidoreductase
MERNREMAMCCGGGGGLSWFEEDTDKRVNDRRVKQASNAVGAVNPGQPGMIVTSCPFCLTMMEEGIAAAETTLTDKDIAELVAESMAKKEH